MKQVIISTLLLSILFPAPAQKKKVESLNKFDIRFGLVDNGRFLYYAGMKGNFRVNLDYNLSKYMSLGGYFGYTQLMRNSYAVPSLDSEKYGNLFFYGVNAYYHFSPHFLQPDFQKKLDLYLRGYFGAKSGKYDVNYMPSDYTPGSIITHPDYGVYFGASYFPIRRVGLNLEVGYGVSYISNIGLAIKLGKLNVY